ncbi:hypothetical protein DSL64_21065 [Dyadobacter luteus]|uniref:DUF4412 domain-containing protein n=1 Tax=Dyadobacter luteus TaxID=2259619 RepID=A0A3D8Y6G3_9BACT|nr:hypothetical protein [Dyadobacter luteus]REA58405.1 hypothetical protein DSL64_21065 [Dyadobacter luteus]
MHKKLTVLLFLTLTACSLLSQAQGIKKITPDKQRALQWKPDKGQYYFSHSIVMTYENAAEKTKGEIKIHLDPVTGTMCFKRESSFQEETFDFIIAFSDGRYFHYGTDEDGKKIKISEKVEDVKPDAETQSQQKENFATYCAPTGNKRVDFGFESLEYDLSYATSENKDKIWITTLPFNTYPIYGFELIEVPASLPVSIDYLYLLSSNQLISEINAGGIKLKLSGINPDPFLAVTKPYQEVKMD